MSKPSFNNLKLDFDHIQSPKKPATKTPKPAVPATRTQRSKAATTQEFLQSKMAAAEQNARRKVEGHRLADTFPQWNEANRGVPNPFMRSGLFSVKTTSTRDFLDKIPIFSLSNYDISYTGRELQQEDLSVWMALINMAKDQPMSDAIYFTGYQLIVDLGWSLNTESYRRARASIERLQVTGISIETHNKAAGYSGPLIREFKFENDTGEEKNTKWMVRFEPKVSVMFMSDTVTLLEWEMRKKIGGRSPLAQWLHGFYATHEKPFGYSVAKLHEMCRSGDTISSFRRSLKIALTRCKEKGFLSNWTVDDSDIVHVVRATRVMMLASVGDGKKKNKR